MTTDSAQNVKLARWTYNKVAPQMLAPIKGKLAIHNGCLVLQAGNTIYLPAFPYDEGTWDSLKMALTYRGKVYLLGDDLETNGGNVVASAPELTQAASDIPTCGTGELITLLY